MVGGCIDSKEFEDIAEIYDLIRAQNMNQDRQLDDALLAQQFDIKLKIVMMNINEVTAKSTENNIESSLVSKHSQCYEGLEQLYDLCQSSMMDVMKVRDQSTYDLKILASIIKGHTMLINKNRSFYHEANSNHQKTQGDLKEKIKKLNENNQMLQTQLQNSEIKNNNIELSKNEII